MNLRLDCLTKENCVFYFFKKNFEEYYLFHIFAEYFYIREFTDW